MRGTGLRLGAPAKVNLFLRVLAREESGFHGVETLYAALELQDAVHLELLDEPGVELEVVSAQPLGPREDNLAYRAAVALREEVEEGRGVRILLEKRIPPGTGLGGGSSDAAATLRGLNRLLGSPLERPELVRLAGELGSDVPFFLSPSPLALGWSRGHRLMALDPLPVRPVLLALPPHGVSTREAYATLARERQEAGGVAPGAAVLEQGLLGSWGRLAAVAGNDFEGPVFRNHPRLQRVASALADTGPTLSLLAGSGSAIFAVYSADPVSREAREALAEEFPDVNFVLTRTLRAFPAPGAP